MAMSRSQVARRMVSEISTRDTSVGNQRTPLIAISLLLLLLHLLANPPYQFPSSTPAPAVAHPWALSRQAPLVGDQPASFVV